VYEGVAAQEPERTNLEWKRALSIVTSNNPTAEEAAHTTVITHANSIPVASAPRLHLAYLDGLRALAALYVVLHHASRYAFDLLPPDRMTPAQKLFAFLFQGGDDAVVLFIVLSGFCLMLPVVRGDGTLRGGALHFFGKRARRILPPYYFAVGFSLLMICLLVGTKTGTAWDDCTDITPLTLVTHLFLMHDVLLSTAHGINYPLWTVSVEWQIYFLFPFLVWAWRRFGPVKTVVSTLVLSLLTNEALKNTQLINTSPMMLGAFALGMLGAGIAYGDHARLAAWRQRIPWPWLTLGLAFAFYIPVVLRRDHFLGATLTLMLFAVLSVSLIVLAARPGVNPLNRALSWNPLVAVGLFSYSIYLLHAPLLQLIWQYGLASWHLAPVPLLLVLAVIGVPLIVAASYIFSTGCERPFLNSQAKATTNHIMKDMP